MNVPKEKLLKAFLFVAIPILAVTNIGSQSIEPAGIINNSHYYENANGIRLQSSVGEVAIERFTAEGQVLTQGFLQQYTTLVSTGKAPLKVLKITIGPNPCTSSFVLTKSINTALDAYLYDANHCLLKTIHLGKLSTTVDISNLPSGTYFLNVFEQKSEIFKTFKLIKI